MILEIKGIDSFEKAEELQEVLEVVADQIRSGNHVVFIQTARLNIASVREETTHGTRTSGIAGIMFDEIEIPSSAQRIANIIATHVKAN